MNDEAEQFLARLDTVVASRLPRPGGADVDVAERRIGLAELEGEDIGGPDAAAMPLVECRDIRRFDEGNRDLTARRPLRLQHGRDRSHDLVMGDLVSEVDLVDVYGGLASAHGVLP